MDGWSVRICPQTVSSRVGLQSGPSRDDNEVWGEWVKGSGQNEIRFPAHQQGLDPIYFQANNFQEQQVELCVLYDGQVKKHYSFDGENEWHNIERSDSDECPC
jgi:hypothetical protein